MSQLPPPPPPAPPEPPQYNLYRSRKRLRDRLGPAGRSPLDALRRQRRPKAPGEPTPKRGFTWRRGFKWAAIAVGVWILVSIASFFISAQTAPGVDQKTKNALAGGGTLLTGSNVLVLGSDQRPKNSKEPGANQGPPRSDSIIILHVGVGRVIMISVVRVFGF